MAPSWPEPAAPAVRCSRAQRSTAGVSQQAGGAHSWRRRSAAAWRTLVAALLCDRLRSWGSPLQQRQAAAAAPVGTDGHGSMVASIGCRQCRFPLPCCPAALAFCRRLGSQRRCWLPSSVCPGRGRQRSGPPVGQEAPLICFHFLANRWSSFTLCFLQGEADSALDHLWTKKRAEIGQ